VTNDEPQARLFGTDGVRGLANRELTPELALRLGRAGGGVLQASAGRATVLVGRDTRRSGDMLTAALAAGLLSVGADVHDAGVCPTPGIAFLTREGGYAGGAVVSASHNPFADNGIKLFGAAGTKLDDAQEDAIEAALRSATDNSPRPVGAAVGRYRPASDLVETYARHVAGTVRCRLDGLKIVLDCAHGATAGLAPSLFESLGARVELLGTQPSGDNINAGVGSTHPAAMAAAVVALRADLGFAFDGDGDRVIGADEAGRIVDGDAIMAICALDMLRRGALPGKTMVATVMSNYGLDAAVSAAGGQVIRTPVGDRHVAQAMRNGGLLLGGEQAGHIIFLAHNTTGDGMITALQVLDMLVGRGVSLGEATRHLVWYPQEHRSIRFADRAAAGRAVDAAATRAACLEVEAALAGHGRVVLRASGTEPLVRILVEAPTGDAARRAADFLAEVVGRTQS